MVKSLLRFCCAAGLIGLILTGLVTGGIFTITSFASAESVHTDDVRFDSLYFGEDLTEKTNEDTLIFVNEVEENTHINNDSIVTISEVEKSEEVYWAVIEHDPINAEYVEAYVNLDSDRPVVISDTETNTFYYYEMQDTSYEFTPKGHLWWLAMMFGGMLIVGVTMMVISSEKEDLFILYQIMFE